MDVAAALTRSGLFEAATPDERAAVVALAGLRRLPRGQVLFAEGDASDALYVVQRGRVAVLLTSPRGDELVLAVLGPGDALGELSVLDGRPRSATARALEDSELVAVPSRALRALLARSPGLALSWALEMSATVRRLTGVTGDLVFLDLSRRLAKLLLEGGGRDVELGMTQTEVAARLGVARQSVNRALSSLQSRGWVQVLGSHIDLRDRAALERFAGS
jgi:CRP/FNR family cyclic AMP-dependent transcriptional regulator